MQCRSCGFENTPNQVRCFRCGAVIIVDPQLGLVPSRMPGWKRPFRRVARYLRRLIGDQIQSPEIAYEIGWLSDIVLKLIPGLPYLLSARLVSIWPLLLTWLILIGLMLFFYGVFIGYVTMAIAVGVHTWLILRHRIWDMIKGPAERLGLALGLGIALFVGYHSLSTMVLPRPVRSSFQIPTRRVYVGIHCLPTGLCHHLDLVRLSSYRPERSLLWWQLTEGRLSKAVGMR